MALCSSKTKLIMIEACTTITAMHGKFIVDVAMRYQVPIYQATIMWFKSLTLISACYVV